VPTAAPTAAPTAGPTTAPTSPSTGNGSTTIGVPAPAPPTGAAAAPSGPGIAPAALIAAVSLAATPTTPSTGNGSGTTIDVKPPAPPSGPGTAASEQPTSTPTIAPSPAPTAAPTAAPTPAPTVIPRAPVLKPSTVDADNSAFVGTAAANTTRLTLALAGGDAALAQKLSVAPGVEIRSAGKLTLASDWNLQPVSGTRVGEAAVITLRAGGELLISNSLSDGFAAALAAGDKRAITAEGLAQRGSAASFRLIGGADLGAADPLGVNSSSTAGVTLGRAAASSTTTPPVVFVRSTTGSIAIAAAGDVNLGAALNAQGSNGQVRIYTTGEPVAASDMAGFERSGALVSDQQLIRAAAGNGSGSALGPFFEHAGDITISAGRDLRGQPSTIYPASGEPTSVQYVTDWWWRQTNPTTADKAVALWSRYDKFAQGIASFGGGSIELAAGRDLIDVDVSTPASGYAVQAKGEVGKEGYLPAQAHWWAGR